MKIKIYFQVAGEVKESSQRFPLAILPPIQSTDPAVGFSSGQAAAAGVENADDIILPAYEPPPTYEGDLKT